MTPPTPRDAVSPGSNVRPLEASLFSFYGFDDAATFERRAGRLGIRGGEPAVAIVDDALFVPGHHRRNAGEIKAYGGIYDPAGRPVDLAQLRRKGRPAGGAGDGPIEVALERTLDEEVVFLGPLFNHYGRVLLESLARVWYLPRVDPGVRVVFDFPTTAASARWGMVRPILDRFGIPPERLLVLEEPTRLRRAIVPEPLFEQMHAAHAGMVVPFRAVAAEIVGGLEPSTQPLYLSRRLLDSRQRPIVGEAELEDVLRENGFLVANPETMTFADQVRLLNAHADVFAGIGSAAHTALFALHRPRLHLLTTDERISANYYLCSALAEAPTTFINCLGTGHRPDFSAGRGAGEKRTRGGDDEGASAGTGPMATPHLAEIDRLVVYLDERGFLKKRLRATLAGRDPGLRHRYEEAWLFARVRKALAQHGALLPPEIEHEALSLAPRSWPISMLLARYYWTRHQDRRRADHMVRRFADLVAGEFDVGRLVRYRSDVAGTVSRLTRVVEPETAARLTAVLADRFLGGLDEPAADSA